MPNRFELISAKYPKVTKIVKAARPIVLDVQDVDIGHASRKSPDHCVAAECCRRQLGADGVMIFLSVCYVIQGDTATTYTTPPTLAREIVAFDRGALFYPGKYVLGRHNWKSKQRSKHPKKHIRTRIPAVVSGVLHHTQDIRQAWG
jgi:hypothetical protein